MFTDVYKSFHYSRSATMPLFLFILLLVW